MNWNKVLLLIMIFSSTMISISSPSWIGMWMGMEINMISFIPLMAKNKNVKMSQAMMIYFLTQSIGSLLLLFSVLMNFIVMSYFMMKLFSILLTMSLSLKLGIAPFHMWFPEMMSNMCWPEMSMLMTWQKFAPLYMLSNITNNFMFMLIIFSSILGAIGGINNSSIRKIMAYSSINHLSWILMMMINQTQWIIYLLIYTINVLMISYFFHFNNLYFINQIPNKVITLSEKFIYSSLMLSMGGMPPFMGFLPKWMAITAMINNNMYMIIMIMISMSLITLFYYMRIIFPLMLNFNLMNKWNFNKNNKWIMTMMFINLSLPMASIMNFY
uniref:NADH-ubiquinone oxidoreductase chain 2 n=1 Tax=Malcus inconspicuus TaxID=498929 RepID=B7SMF3_9HEMI|nr:NADH dehydrogenase subunit 2 [Malcus inconspicuus]ABZ02047.1 NADH dehydrogenase subunit 2 [Malcus inconspicuus]